MFFFLDEPQILLPKKEREKLAGRQEEVSNIQYIPYKTRSNCPIAGDTASSVAYPEKWGGQTVGISYSLRQRRNRLFEILTPQDLRINGTAVLNPLIGQLPERRQMETEVEQLLQIL